MRYKTIYIAGINRSGGSLLSRLFDGHPDILSYPTELGFPTDNNFYEITDSYSGIPQTIQTLILMTIMIFTQYWIYQNKNTSILLHWERNC